jgi:hypothetical protein
MQVLTTGCVTDMEVSVPASPTRFGARRADFNRQSATTAWQKAELLRWASKTLRLHQSANEFDRAAVLKNSDRTTSYARPSRTKQIRARRRVGCRRDT